LERLTTKQVGRPVPDKPSASELLARDDFKVAICDLKGRYAVTNSNGIGWKRAAAQKVARRQVVLMLSLNSTLVECR
jgi:hypothetical protein